MTINGDNQTSRNAPLTSADVEFLVWACGVDAGLLAEMQRQVEPSHFNESTEYKCRLTWCALAELATNKQPVSYHSLVAASRTYLQRYPELGRFMSPEDWAELTRTVPQPGLFSLIADNHSVPYGEADKAYSREILRRFVNERAVIAQAIALLGKQLVADHVPDGSQLLHNLSQQASKLLVRKNTSDSSLFSETDDYTIGEQTEDTHVDYLRTLIGGQRRKDVIGLVGPTGGGKTTTALHIAGQQALAQFNKPKNQRELIVFITIEEAPIKLRSRILASMLNIHRDKFKNKEFVDGLSTEAPPIAANTSGAFDLQLSQMSERDRYMALKQVSEQNFKFMDLSGADGHALCNYQSVVGNLNALQQEAGVPIKSVFVDYAGLFVQRLMNTDNLDSSQYITGMARVGDQFLSEVAVRFNCTTFLVHQMSGAFNAASATKIPTLADTEGSKNFAVNMAACLSLGVEDTNNNCRWMAVTKLRYGQRRGNAAVVLQINDFAQMVDVTDRYAVSYSKFVPAAAIAITGQQGAVRRSAAAGTRPAGLV